MERIRKRIKKWMIINSKFRNWNRIYPNFAMWLVELFFAASGEPSSEHYYYYCFTTHISRRALGVQFGVRYKEGRCVEGLTTQG